ncbi:MAG: MFS transporter, partial [Janthinobacterium lividum]
MSHSHASSSRMSGLELRATLSLAAIFALRMLGLFMIMPVFSIYA